MLIMKNGSKGQGIHHRPQVTIWVVIDSLVAICLNISIKQAAVRVEMILGAVRLNPRYYMYAPTKA